MSLLELLKSCVQVGTPTTIPHCVFNLPKDNLHVLLTQQAQEGDDCGFEEDNCGLIAYENRNMQ